MVGVVPLVVADTTTEARNYEAVLSMSYGVDQSAHVVLHGSAGSADVHLDTSLASLDATYITLTSQTRVVVRNNSDVPVNFSWKGLADEDREEDERRRLFSELDRMYSYEREALESQEWQAAEDGETHT